MTEREWLTCDDPMPMLGHLLRVPLSEVGRGELDDHGNLIRGGWESSDPPPLPYPADALATKDRVGDRALRLFACACCRRVWEVFGDDAWTIRHVPPDSSGCRTNPGPTGKLDDLFDDTLSRAAVDAAEGWCGDVVSAEQLRAAGAVAWGLAVSAYKYYGWADYRLGDHYSASEYDESARSYLTARAASLVCASDIQRAVGEAAQAAREAIESRWCGQPAKPSTEWAIQANLLRDIICNPFRPITLHTSWLTSTVLALATGIYEEKAFDRMPILADALQDAGCDNYEILNHCRGSEPHCRGCYVVDLVLGMK